MDKDKTDIKTDIQDQLFWDNRVLSTDVNIDVDDSGHVTLKGTVPSSFARRAAAEDAWMVAGVKKVDNQISVKYPTSITVPTDSEIKSNIESAFLWDVSLNSTKIDVQVTAGIATLEGTVDSYWKKIHAENKASDITGVLSVINKIAVVPTEDFIDEDIATDIVDSIDRKVAVNVDDVTVKVSDGNVTLSGSLPDYSAWSAAYDSALYTAGVRSIVDNTIIS